MPSPFPGMDPFLEDPAIFPDLHDSMIFCLREALQPRLPEPYYALGRARVWVETSERHVEPDVDVMRSRHDRATGEAGTQALLPSRSQAVIVPLPQQERRQPFLEIYARRQGGDRLVTSIEVLSPDNKRPGERARQRYRRKQEDVLSSRTNLVEIDLLRGGRHTTAVPLRRFQRHVGPCDYHVCVSCFHTPEQILVYPIRLEESLPEIAVPLLPETPPVGLDLQTVFNRCYDTGPYHRLIRYAPPPPPPPLRPEQAEWVDRLLREKGLLSSP